MASRLSYPLLVVGVALAGFMFGMSFQMRAATHLALQRVGLPFVEGATALNVGMTIEGDTLHLTGALDANSYDVFTRIAGDQSLRAVALDSPGGSLDAALRIAKEIRERGFNTRVPEGALCASSCPLLLAAGIRRTVERGGSVGVHRIRIDEMVLSHPPGGMSEGQFGVMVGQISLGAVLDHLDEMGVVPEFWLLGVTVPSDRLRLLTDEEIRRYGLANR